MLLQGVDFRVARQEKMLLQGVGVAEFSKYNMVTLSPCQLSDMVGNAFLVHDDDQNELFKHFKLTTSQLILLQL